MERASGRGGWRCVSTEFGGQYVMTSSRRKMQRWCVGNLEVSIVQVRMYVDAVSSYMLCISI